jgi:hypothetical protein
MAAPSTAAVFAALLPQHTLRLAEARNRRSIAFPAISTEPP